MICELCNGSRRVAIGPWGVNPPKVTCPECKGTGIVELDHVYRPYTAADVRAGRI